MRVERPDPNGLPVVYTDDGRLLSDPNADPPIDRSVEELDAEADDAEAPLEQPAFGSNRERWVDYAEAHGIVIAEDTPRDEIIEQLRSIGVVRSDNA